jgi:hypothetical protein
MVQGEGGLGGVMAFKLPRGTGGLWLVRALQGFRVNLYRSYDSLNTFPGHAPRTEDPGPAGGKIQHRGFHADTGTAPIQDHGNPVSQLFLHMLRTGGGKTAKAIGAGSSYGSRGAADELLRCRMIRETDRHRGKSGSGKVRDPRLFGEDQGQGAWPQALYEGIDVFPCYLVQSCQIRYPFKGVYAGDVDDQGIETGPFLDLKYSCQGSTIKDIRTKAVHRFCGKGNQ